MKMLNEKNNNVIQNEDKYKDKPLKFFDKVTHYELFFVDEFNYPDKDYTVLTDIIIDLKNSDKSKELHIWINSYGGYVINLISLMQVVREFDYVVTICNGAAMSCGFMLWCCGHEKYVSPYSDLMYHAISMITYGKSFEVRLRADFIERQTSILIETTGINKILTEEEIVLGKTSEVWLLGGELIERGIAKDFALYKDRIIPTKSDVFKIGDYIYEKENGTYIKYEKSKDKPINYFEILEKSKEDNRDK